MALSRNEVEGKRRGSGRFANTIMLLITYALGFFMGQGSPSKFLNNSEATAAEQHSHPNHTSPAASHGGCKEEEITTLKPSSTRNPDNEDANEIERMAGISDQMNEICEQVLKKGKHGHRFVPWTTFMFCQTHKMVYRRSWLYPKATRATESPESGHSGDPYQMAMQQYMGIALSAAQTTRHNYTVEPPKRLEGKRPRILFIGCGADTPFWQGTADYLGGTIVFVDFYEQWAKDCATTYEAESVIFQNITGNIKDQMETLKELARPDVEKKTSFLHLVNDERYRQFALDLPDELIKSSAEPWDIIVVDAPGGTREGRAKPFYSALRIALSAPKDSFSRVYLHDTNRGIERLIARAFAGFHPAVFLGNQMPRKGLFEWRVEGMSIPYDATSAVSTS